MSKFILTWLLWILSCLLCSNHKTHINRRKTYMFVCDFNEFPELFYSSVATCHGHDSSCCKSEFIEFQLNFDLDSKRRVSEWLTPPFCLLEPSSQKTWTRRSPSPAGPTIPTAIIIAITTIKNINFLIIFILNYFFPNFLSNSPFCPSLAGRLEQLKSPW